MLVSASFERPVDAFRHVRMQATCATSSDVLMSYRLDSISTDPQWVLERSGLSLWSRVRGTMLFGLGEMAKLSGALWRILAKSKSGFSVAGWAADVITGPILDHRKQPFWQHFACAVIGALFVAPDGTSGVQTCNLLRR